MDLSEIRMRCVEAAVAFVAAGQRGIGAAQVVAEAETLCDYVTGATSGGKPAPAKRGRPFGRKAASEDNSDGDDDPLS